MQRQRPLTGNRQHGCDLGDVRRYQHARLLRGNGGPAARGVVLALKLDAGGFRVEATAEVRVAYPGLGMESPLPECQMRTVPGCGNWWLDLAAFGDRVFVGQGIAQCNTFFLHPTSIHATGALRSSASRSQRRRRVAGNSQIL